MWLVSKAFIDFSYFFTSVFSCTVCNCTPYASLWSSKYIRQGLFIAQLLSLFNAKTRSWFLSRSIYIRTVSYVLFSSGTFGPSWQGWVQNWMYCAYYSAQTVIKPVHRGVFCQFPFWWIYYYDSNKPTGKETGKMHLCAIMQSRQQALRAYCHNIYTVFDW